MAVKKKQLIAAGQLDKHGRPNDKTPKEYLRAVPDIALGQVEVDDGGVGAAAKAAAKDKDSGSDKNENGIDSAKKKEFPE